MKAVWMSSVAGGVVGMAEREIKVTWHHLGR
jgi:hypothetical protein